MKLGEYMYKVREYHDRVFKPTFDYVAKMALNECITDRSTVRLHAFSNLLPDDVLEKLNGRSIALEFKPSLEEEVRFVPYFFCWEGQKHAFFSFETSLDDSFEALCHILDSLVHEVSNSSNTAV